VEQGNTTRTSQAGISAALAAAVRFPGEDGGSSMAEMARNDLDAALQLLADRAQYITGANGAAIALRRGGKNDMQCRASSGANVPELGALLSTEFGISGESVRTRKPLRCDDAERDPRVNREGCRQLGIASVVVMPVVTDDEVLGVFELFSGKVNAFGERDLSALQRLSEMVETAVQLARAAEKVPQVTVAEVPAVDVAADESDDLILGEGTLDEDILLDETPAVQGSVLEGKVEAATEPSTVLAASAEAPVVALPIAPPIAPLREVAPALPVQAALPKKPLFWSVASNPVPDAEKPAEADQSHVPPVLRNLRTCEACGFPVSPGRALCVECEEKRWRGQLRRPSARPVPAPKPPAFDPLRPGFLAKEARNGAPAVEAPSGPVARLVAAAAATQSAVAASAPVRQAPPVIDVVPAPVMPVAAPTVVPEAVREVASAPVVEKAEAPSPDFVLTAGLEPSESWLAANISLIVVLLLVAGAVAVTIILH
jgi:GAF domain-containing protein